MVWGLGFRIKGLGRCGLRCKDSWVKGPPSTSSYEDAWRRQEKYRDEKLERLRAHGFRQAGLCLGFRV